MDIEPTIQEILRGDIERYAEIVKWCYGDVHKVVAAMLLDSGETEDLILQVFTDAYRHLNEHRSGSDFRAWIKMIARNRVKNELRRCSRERLRLKAYATYVEAVLDRGAEDEQHRQRRVRALRHCLNRLPARQRNLVDLHYVHCQPYEEIAAHIGKTKDAVKMAFLRIRVALRRCVERQVAGS